MGDALVLALGFKRPAKFDLAAHWKRSTASFKEQRQRYIATLALTPEAVLGIESWYAVKPVPKHPAARALAEGWCAFDIEFESPRLAQFVTLGLGSGAKVLAPDELSRQIRRELAQMARD
jgi:predicted DNA-binding transcriptional regulator YafY